MEIEELLLNFGKKIGFDNLQLEEDGVCSLGCKDVIIHIKPTDEGRRVLVFGMVMDMPKEIEFKVLHVLLQGNYLFGVTKGATLGIDDDGSTIFLQRLEPIAALNEDSFAELVEQFIDTILFWRELLTDAMQNTVADQDDTTPDGYGAEKIMEMYKMFNYRC